MSHREIILLMASYCVCATSVNAEPLIQWEQGVGSRTDCRTVVRDGISIVSGGHADGIHRWDPLTGREIGVYAYPYNLPPLERSLGRVQILRVGENGLWGAITSNADVSRVPVWRLGGNRIEYTCHLSHLGGDWSRSDQRHVDLAASSDGRFIATTTRGNDLYIWDSKARTVRIIETDRAPERISFRPQSHELTFVHGRSGYRRIVAEDGKHIGAGYPRFAGFGNAAEIDEDTFANAQMGRLVWLSHAPNGRDLALAYSRGAFCVVDIDTGRTKCEGAVREFNKTFVNIFSMTFDAASQRIALGTWNGEVEIWDVATGTRKAVLSGKTRRAPNVPEVITKDSVVTAIAFTADGSRVIGMFYEGLRCWSLGP